MERKQHWEQVYETKAPDAVSWYVPHLGASLRYIKDTGLDPQKAHIIDVGGGESTLVDDLLAAGYRNVSVLDISEKALEVAAERLGSHAGLVMWIAADILEYNFAEASIDIWHDRAVFHFLTTDEQRQAYVAQVLKALRPGGFAIVGTFGPNGPEKCSGLPVMRYAPDALHDTFGTRFTLLEHAVDMHTTPWGSSQEFVYCFCRREG
jgi:SAM-dependent methyltransferase